MMPEEGEDNSLTPLEVDKGCLSLWASCDRCTRHSWGWHRLSSLGLQLSGWQGVKLDQRRLRRCQRSPAPAHGRCCAVSKAAALLCDGLVPVRDRLFLLSALVQTSLPGFSSELSFSVWSCF